MTKKNNIEPCKVCGEQFDNVFEATDHLLDGEGEKPFDPMLILPNGYSLMVGSLLRCLYGYADDPDEIKRITESTYATLYAAEVNVGDMRELVEDMIVSENMIDFEEELKELLKGKSEDGK